MSTTGTSITYFRQGKGLTHQLVNNSLNSKKDDDISDKYLIDRIAYNEYEPWDLSKSAIKDIKNKIDNLSNIVRLKDITEFIFVGIQSGKDEVFFVDDKTKNDFNLEKDIVIPIYRGRDILRYNSDWSGTSIIYPYNKSNNSVIDESTLKSNYPNVYRYLVGKRDLLKGRDYFDKSNKLWYELWCERNYVKFQEPKIVVAEISPENRFYYDDQGFLGNTKTFNIVLTKNLKDTYLYILGLLNSKLLEFYHKQISVPKAGGFFEYKTQFLNLYPIIFATPDTITEINKLVLSLVKMKKLLFSSKTPTERTAIERQIQATDAQIDKLVYQLYGLTEEEIKIVEQS